jgi:hypothetical protein
MTEPKALSALELELRAAKAPVPVEEAAFDEKTRAQLAELRQQNAAFHAARDANAWCMELEKRRAAQRPESKPTTQWTGFLRPRWGGPILATAFAALVWVQVQEPTPSAPLSPPSGIRSKGDLRLDLRVSWIEGTQSRALMSGDITHPGDVIQLQVTGAVQRKDMVVFSIDGRGALTLHYPKNPGEPLAQDGILPRSFELDDAPAFERFFLVSGEKLPVDEVLQVAQKMAARRDAVHSELEFPAHFSSDVAQSTFLLRKEVP